MNASESRKVIIRLAGGLGNQLFGYATARRLAVKNNAELVVDSVSGFAYDATYKRTFQLQHFSGGYRLATPSERLEPFSRIRRYLKRLFSKYKTTGQTFLTDYTNSFDPAILSFKFEKSVYIEGYWQDQRYFKDCEGLIRKDLKIRPPTDDTNIVTSESIKENLAIAIHVRFFFDPDTGEDIGAMYYNYAIAEMETKFENPHYFVFSDNPEEARKKISLPSERVNFVCHNGGDENSYADLWLMSLCDHFIIASSTFSWWAAWLSENESKYVIAPDYRIHGGGNASKVFDRMILEEWRKM